MRSLPSPPLVLIRQAAVGPAVIGRMPRFQDCVEKYAPQFSATACRAQLFSFNMRGGHAKKPSGVFASQVACPRLSLALTETDPPLLTGIDPLTLAGMCGVPARRGQATFPQDEPVDSPAGAWLAHRSPMAACSLTRGACQTVFLELFEVRAAKAWAANWGAGAGVALMPAKARIRVGGPAKTWH